MQQVLVIHGGDSFSTYEAYVEFLKGLKVDIEDWRKIGWKLKLGERLGDTFAVYNPKMPNPWFAKYAEWKMYFEKCIPQLEPNVILVGHSLGGSFLARYLSEEDFPKKIRAMFLVSPPFDVDGNRPLADFAVSRNLSKLAQQAGEIYLYHSKDDDVVSYQESERFQAALPQAHVRVFEDRGHFTADRFPEIEEDLRAVAHAS